MLNHFELFGLQQVSAHWRGQEPQAHAFKIPLFYRFCRHPIMLGFIIAFWATPHMTTGHLLFAVATTVYILIALQLEERDLVNTFGDTYVEYRQRVSMLMPLPPRR
jgi:protein-S-isoprenylcysteine O-methyltransferase Ste14